MTPPWKRSSPARRPRRGAWRSRRRTTISAAWVLDVRIDGDEVVLNGTKRPVDAATTADLLLVTGRTGDGLTNVLVPSDTPGVSIRALKSTDLTRRFGAVDFDDVRLPLTALVGEAGGAGDEVEWATLLGLTIAAAESVGAMQAAFDMTVEWAFDRYAFGRPLASYQALKHRFADMQSWLDASHAIADAAAVAVATDDPQAADLVVSAAAYIGQYGPDLAHDCVQIHGGIGVTFEHDLHLYLRRIVVNRAAFASPADHRRRLADLIQRHAEERTANVGTMEVAS